MDKIVPRAQQGVIVTEDDSPYYSVVTNIGREKIAQALKTGTPLEIKEIALGDANGSSLLPDRTATKLVHEVWRGECVTMLDPSNPSTVLAKTNVPITVGGWMVYEIGVIDKDGNIIIHANAPGWIKLAVVNGMSNPMEIAMRLSIVDADAIHLSISYDGVNLTFKDLADHNKDQTAHMGHFQDMKLHVSEDDRENWDNPLLVATVNLSKDGWKRDPDGVTYIQDVTAQLPPETVLANMDLAIKADPNLIAQMVDGNIGLVAEQSKGKIIFHALREIPGISMYAQVSLYRSKSGEAKIYYSNLLGNPGTIGTPLPLPIEPSSIKLSNQSTNTQLKIHGTHINPSLDWDATRIVRGENVAPVGPTDGVLVADGKITSFDDTNGLKAGVKYIFAYFPRNAAGNYQMSATTAEITIPAQKPLAPTSVSAKDTTDKNAFAATLTIQLPTDVYRDHIVVVRKEGSAPASMSDGTVVYTGKDTTVRDTTSTNYGIDYHWAVYTVNAEGTVCDTPARANLSLKPIVPEQVTQTSAADASAPEYGYRVLVKTKIPADVNAYKIMVRRKAGEMPATSIDGDLAYEGSNDTFYDLPPFSTQAYHYRVFTVNQAGQLNDKQEGATASVTLTAKEPGAVTNLAATDEKGTTTGSFDLPVVMVEGREAVNRFVTGYVVIQKEGGTPTTEKDGEVIASADIDPKVTGKTVQFTKVGQKNGANLYITVFLKNAAGSYFWSSGQVAQITPRVIPDAYEFLACLTQNTEWTPPEDGFYRITCIGKSGDGATGYRGSYTSRPVRPTVTHSTMSGGYGGSGGAAGGMARSVLELRTSTSVHCTVTTSITSFGDYLSATAGIWNTPGAGTGGTDFVTTGNEGGQGGRGGRHEGETGTAGSKSYPARGNDGKGNGGQGGAARVSSSNFDINNVGGGGGGGGGTYALPSNISYDDPLYTTYIVRDLRNYRGGDGSDGRYVGSGSRYPEFSASNPIWYGGGNGGGGGSAGSYQSWDGFNPGYGSPGSPGGILIEKGVFH